jgi:LAO/AO transport system kinase
MNDAAELIARAKDGDPAAVARLLSWVERGGDRLRQVYGELRGDSHAYVLGVTGSPGVGKSTLTAELIRAWRARGVRVAVLAVDPSSPFSGGALLGDRVRMQDFAADRKVYIRSMASRGHLGGLSAAVPDAVRVAESVGFDVVIVETVGVGQAEVDIATLADSTAVLLAPGMGDGVQSVKAGVLEIADVFVVNKSDRPGTDTAVRDLKNLLALGGRHSEPGSWRPRIVNTVATTAAGIADLMAAFDAHRDWLERSGTGLARRVGRFAMQLEAIVLAQLRQRLLGLSDAERNHTADSEAGNDPVVALGVDGVDGVGGGIHTHTVTDAGGLLRRLAEQVRRGERDVYEAAEVLRTELTQALVAESGDV